MKRILRRFILTVFCLWVVTAIVPGALKFTPDFNSGLLIAALVIMALDIFIRPIINLIFLPLNLITLGTFRWVALIAVFWIADYLLDNFSINSFTLHSFTVYNFTVPTLSFSGIWTYVSIGMFINLLMGFIFWLFK